MDFTIREMFCKKIDRPIKGVIKVGQNDSKEIMQELEEYVITNELKRHIDEFFESYKAGITGHTDDMGVWLQGFFGSGKSHLLKILSYLLANKEIEGKRATEYFKNKGLDNFTLANMELAGNISTEVMLFNIDSKSDSDSKNSKEAIVNVFNKVFNEMQGYCGTLPWLAELEKQLDNDGLYDVFKNNFKEISDKDWIDAREDFYYEEDFIVEALVKTRGIDEEAARKWYEKAEENYSISIEKFAKKVNAYIEEKGDNHHLVFLVDEIGQYIGDNTQLMLNLQTVVEDLGRFCLGKCWVIVTSQEALDEFTKNIKGNDFSKIQGRFKTRLSLSSGNVDEVIKMRILRKKDEVRDYLKLFYDKNESVIKNLLDFTSNDAEMKIYKNSDDFADVYPFVPYQFNLLQAAFNGVREHGAAGKSLSKGERSLLGAYQQVAIDYMEKTEDILVPFSAFYKTIETFLDSGIKSVVINASKNDELNDFDVEVLKLLFLTKYVKEIKSNVKVLSTLLVSNVHEDRAELEKKVKESLRRLVRQTLIQENGEEYVFLTNDEQDINKEIKSMAVDGGVVTQKIEEIIFDDIYKTNKFAYSKEYNFAFNKKIDGELRGKQISDLTVNIITANYELYDEASEYELKMQSSREESIIIDISGASNYIEEIENVLKIDNYLRVKAGVKASSTIEDIKAKKSRERDDRLKRAKDLIEDAISNSKIYVSGESLEIKTKKPAERINEGLKALVKKKYSSLDYIKKFYESPADLYGIMDKKIIQGSLFDKDENVLALTEVRNYVNQVSARKITITAKSLLVKFSKAPYGWKELDISSLIVKLFKNQEIKVTVNDSNLNPDDRKIVDYVTKKEWLEKTTIKMRERVNEKYVKALKDIHRDIFGYNIMLTDEDGMMREFKAKCSNELEKINIMLNNYSIVSYYPGKEVLKKGKEIFEEITKIKDTVEFFKVVYNSEDTLIDYVDNVSEVKEFFYKKNDKSFDFSTISEQRKIFDNAISKVNNYEVNSNYISDDELDNIYKSIKTIVKMGKPYGKIPSLSPLISKYNDRILELLEEGSKPLKDNIENARNEVNRTLKEQGLSENKDLTTLILENFSKLNKDLESLNSFEALAAFNIRINNMHIKLIKSIVNEGNRLKEERERREREEREREEREKAKKQVAAGRENEEEEKVIKKPITINIKTKVIEVRELTKTQVIIKNREDIDRLIETIKSELEKQLEENTIINLI